MTERVRVDTHSASHNYAIQGCQDTSLAPSPTGHKLAKVEFSRYFSWRDPNAQVTKAQARWPSSLRLAGEVVRCAWALMRPVVGVRAQVLATPPPRPPKPRRRRTMHEAFRPFATLPPIT